jgi:hypothetical protein
MPICLYSCLSRLDYRSIPLKRFAATLLVLLMTASMHAATIHVNNLTGKDNAKGTSAD